MVICLGISLLAGSAVTFAVGLLPLLVFDRRATSHLSTSITERAGAPPSIGPVPAWLLLVLLRITYALAFSFSYVTALSWANPATSPSYRDSWALYLPAYYGRSGGATHAGTVSSRKHYGHSSASSSAHSHTQSRPNERVIFLFLTATLTSALVPFVFARTSSQGAARQPGARSVLLFHPSELQLTLGQRCLASVFPKLRGTNIEPEPGKEPAHLFLTHTLATLLLPPAVYLPIYTMIRRPLYRSLLVLIMQMTPGDGRHMVQTLSGSVRSSSIAGSAASSLRYYLIPSLRAGTFSFLFNIELFLRPALLSAAIFAVAELSISLCRVYASQPLLVSDYANGPTPTTSGGTATAPGKDSYAAPTHCLADAISKASPTAAGKDLYMLHLAVAELAVLSGAPDATRRRAIFNDFGSVAPASRSAALGLDSLGAYNAGLRADRESSWAQIAKAGIRIMREETAAVRTLTNPAFSSKALVKAEPAKGEGDKSSRPAFGRDAYVPFSPPSTAKTTKDGPPSVYKTPPAPRSVWDKLAEEVASGGRTASSPSTASQGGTGAAPSALIPAATPKAGGAGPKVLSAAATFLRLFLPPNTSAPPQSSTAVSLRSENAAVAPMTPLDAASTVFQSVKQNTESALQGLGTLLPERSREIVQKKTQEIVPSTSGQPIDKLLQLLLPVSPQTLARFSPLLAAELKASSTSRTLDHVLPPHPALAVWIAQALSHLATASLTEDEFGCVQQASRASARARSRKLQCGAAGEPNGAGAGVCDLLEAMLELWEAVHAAIEANRPAKKEGDPHVVSAWEKCVHDTVLLPLRGYIGEVWTSFERFGAEVGFGGGEQEGRWHRRVQDVLLSVE
ncbi:hypothetical protein OC846_000347 [Tilletia horrida]|uniref:Nucleoporin NDC1 n=1 Tax=Tilletia horrida TaxID=155126 RepID=A0AAN6JTY0_9BASI|nr:hypothetical protein OC846_000347 [Tilletia horrida]